MFKVNIENFYKAKNYLFDPDKEFSETLCTGSNFKLERIISKGHITPANKWYNQSNDEWVILLSGSAVILFEDGKEISLNAGDYLFIPAHFRHRIVETSINSECFWLALHGKIDIETNVNQ